MSIWKGDDALRLAAALVSTDVTTRDDGSVMRTDIQECSERGFYSELSFTYLNDAMMGEFERRHEAGDVSAGTLADSRRIFGKWAVHMVMTMDTSDCPYSVAVLRLSSGRKANVRVPFGRAVSVTGQRPDDPVLAELADTLEGGMIQGIQARERQSGGRGGVAVLFAPRSAEIDRWTCDASILR